MIMRHKNYKQSNDNSRIFIQEKLKGKIKKKEIDVIFYQKQTMVCAHMYKVTYTKKKKN